MNEQQSNALIGMISQHQLGKSEIFQQSIEAQRETNLQEFDEDGDGKLDWREVSEETITVCKRSIISSKTANSTLTI